ncbi:gamma-glutamyl-gamma-aminobutyrate hydrolase family protein [Nocardioides agariphilus]|jgi:gamma-glutamyl-gamma-aminobutyrate hydrolase PuuD|uniref:Gamma-glutamyl-gamma-aminobutyrate hydrolase family protein n=1 Tax=Nocardioides agariphilus TaxID=433664 RepID=A0A930YJC8_9ACTN|nr:gamma-glutamyl-gamma-aminobutyrate hydrolase family protein [Nocardioides agariphilus]MBF4769033.1 gamma-glutamyl-gamma-aminobutyrate hydrolase family protein [Nocardioides agariphilus]
MRPRRPVVGIVGHRYAVPRPHVTIQATGTPETYVDEVARAGGLPIVLPAGRAVETLGLVDAVVLTGGGDVEPGRYGGETHTALDVDPRRDDEEVLLIRAAAVRGIPLLGVCRGLQLLVVAFGGTLVGHLDAHRNLAGHAVRTEPTSTLRELLGVRAHVTSLHHQAVAHPGDSWRVTARADDAVVEGIEWSGPTSWSAIGVQWHPELPHDETGDRIFGWLVEAAAQRDGEPALAMSAPAQSS